MLTTVGVPENVLKLDHLKPSETYKNNNIIQSRHHILKYIEYSCIASCKKIMSRSEFDKNIFSLSKDPSSATFTRDDIVDKISMLQSMKPLVDQKNDLSKLQRVHDRYELFSYQGWEIIYLKSKTNAPAKRVLSIEELFDKLEMLHKIEGNHTGRTKLYKRASQEYHGVTEKICGLFVKTCQVCHLKK